MDKKSKFTHIEYKFDPQKDIMPVDQVGFIDLHDAFINASIPGDIGIDEAAFNGVDDPASLLDRPSDRFEAFRKADYVHKAAAAARAANGGSPEVEPSGSTPSGD